MTRQKRFWLGIGIVVLVVGSALAIIWLLRKAETAPDGDQDTTITYTVETPSETEPSDDYRVPDSQPLRVEIINLGVKGYIQRVGTDQHQAVAAPDNIHMAGWFVDSVLPGQKGLSIIDGHEGGPTMDGIFKQLPNVKAGDEVTITMGGGKTYTYTVFEVRVVDKDQAAAILFDQSPTSTNGQLNLITCTGMYSDADKTYDKRAVVYAVLQP